MKAGEISFLDYMNESEAESTSQRLDKDGLNISEVSRSGNERFEESFAGFMGLLQGKWHGRGISRAERSFRLQEAQNTTDFPYLFGTVIDRMLLAGYKSAADGAWRTYFKVGTQMDFRPQDAIGVYGLEGGLSVVPQTSEYKSDAKMGDGKVQIKLKKYGRTFGLSWESLINDDLGAFNDIAQRLAKAAVRTEYRAATALFCGATAPLSTVYGDTITHPIDGSTIDNLHASTAFSMDNLGTVISSMRHQTDYDGEPIIIDGFIVVVPPALEIAALQALNKAALIAAGGDSTTGIKPVVRTSANVVANMNITLQVNPYLPIINTSTGDTAWYVFADPSNGPAFKMNFLQGHEAPELCMKAPNKLMLGGGQASPLEGDFESDAVQWRVRHVLGGAFIDPRMTHACTA